MKNSLIINCFAGGGGAGRPERRLMNWMEHELTKVPLIKPERKDMKEICKNCIHHKPTYKGGICEVKHKKTKTTGTCEEWRPKR